MFGRVDDFAREHPVALAFEVLRPGETQEHLQGAVVDPVLRIVEQQVAEFDMVTLEPFRIGREKIVQRGAGDLVLVGAGRCEFLAVVIWRHQNPLALFAPCST